MKYTNSKSRATDCTWTARKYIHMDELHARMVPTVMKIQSLCWEI